VDLDYETGSPILALLDTRKLTVRDIDALRTQHDARDRFRVVT